MIIKREEFVWVEKYRPHTIEECILPKTLKSKFSDIISKGVLDQNLLLSGNPGVGKTTVAKALCNELGLDWILLNGSDSAESGIDALRTRVKDFASTISINSKRKVVILDEADYLSHHVQPALRNFMEEFSRNCSFILTCNFKDKILEPLQSRCATIDFKINGKERAEIAADFMKRIEHILDTENVQYSKKVVAQLITKFYPDFRKTINELQKYSTNGVIDTGILSNILDIDVDKIFKYLKDKQFSEVRKWCANNYDNDSQKIYKMIYNSLNEYIKPQSIPQTIITLADYQYKSALVVDQELNLIACLTELMCDAEFK